jgi:hypothetical protein
MEGILPRGRFVALVWAAKRRRRRVAPGGPGAAVRLQPRNDQNKPADPIANRRGVVAGF